MRDLTIPDEAVMAALDAFCAPRAHADTLADPASTRRPPSSGTVARDGSTTGRPAQTRHVGAVARRWLGC